VAHGVGDSATLCYVVPARSTLRVAGMFFYKKDRCRVSVSPGFRLKCWELGYADLLVQYLVDRRHCRQVVTSGYARLCTHPWHTHVLTPSKTNYHPPSCATRQLSTALDGSDHVYDRNFKRRPDGRSATSR